MRRPQAQDTVHYARQYVAEQASKPKGCVCPCCNQNAKVYRRSLNSTMARGLIWLYQLDPEGKMWTDVPKQGPKWLVSKGGTFALLAHWGLIETAENFDKSKRTSGMWRITPLGRQFVERRVQLPSHVYLYAGKVQHFDLRKIYIDAALGTRFNYDQMMKEGAR